MRTGQNEDLLRYYREELTYLRRMGGEFAALYPRVAARLNLGRDDCSDPQVERLLESFAFLTGRLRHDLEGEFPEITTALLGVLYPQFTSPIPSMAVAGFDVDPRQMKLTTGYTIPRETQLVADTPGDSICRFRTSYPVTLWPVKVSDAAVEDVGQFSFLDSMPEIVALLRVKLTLLGEGRFDELSLRRLRFYLKGEPALASKLYELLFCHTQHVAVLSEGERHPVYLPPGSILPVGFADDEAVLPYPAQAHPGYRLLSEYFTFPAKFHFFDLDLGDQRARLRGREVNLLFMLDRAPGDHLALGGENFALGCTPVINLFAKTTEPIRLDHRSLEYRLVPDKRRERTTEIHSVISVSSASPSDERPRDFKPFYSYNHAMDGDEHRAFWHARRRPSLNRDIAGSELYLSFHDLDFRPAEPPARTVYARTLCTNRELATQLPAGTRLQTEEPSPQLGISCLTKPTQPVQPPLRGETLWRLVSHLSLNHLSLSEGGRDARDALREILTLYASSDHPSTRQQIAGLVEMESRKVVRHVGADAWRGFCRGTEVTIEFNEDNYVGSSVFLMGSVLSRFLSLYASVNSFTQLRIRRRARREVWGERRAGVWEEQQEGDTQECPPMVGGRIAL